MNQTTINYLIKAFGGDQAAQEILKVAKAAEKANLSVKKYLNTEAGSRRLLALQTRAAVAASDRAKAEKIVGDATKESAAATDRASRAQQSYFAHIARTTVQSALINKLFLEFVDVSGQAIKQVDLMNNFPDTMRSMGQSTKDAQVAFQSLSTYVGQIGGDLGAATSAVTRFTGVTKDVKSSVAIFQGLNNALVAGDSSMEEQRLAAIQFAQAFERGKPDMREWLALTQNMSFQLSLVAKEMGFVNATALGESLRAGETSMADFTVALTELSTGSGPIAEQALVRMQGMQFAFNVLKNTMVQGLANIINAFGRANIVSFFSFLTQVAQVTTQAIIRLINWLGTLANVIARLLGKGNVFNPITGEAKGTEKATDGIKDNMKDAADSGKELKKSLASFDKMNVLSEPKDKDDDTPGGTEFTPEQLAKLNGLIADMGNGMKEVSTFAKIFAGILGGIAAFKIGQALVDGFNDVNDSMKRLRENIAQTKKDAKNLPTAIADKAKQLPVVVTGSFDKLKGGLAGFGRFLTNPWVLLAAAIATVVGGVIYLLKTNEDFKKGWDSVWNPIIDIVKLAAKTIKDEFKKAFDFVGKIWGDLIKPARPVFDWIGDRFKELQVKLGIVGAPMEKLGKIMALLAVAVVAGMVAPLLILAGVLTGITIGFVLLVKAVVDFAKAVPGAISKLIEDIQAFFVGLWTGMVDGLKAAWGAVYDVLSGPVNAFVDFLKGIGIAIVAVVAILIEGIVKLWAGGWLAILGFMKGIGQWVYDNVIGPILGFFQYMWDTIVFTAKVWWETITQLLSIASGWIQVNITNRIVGFFSAAWEKISGFVGGFVTHLKGVLGVVVGWIQMNVTNRIGGLFDGLWNGIRTGIGWALDGVRIVFAGIVNHFKGYLNGIIDLINLAISGINRLKVPSWVPGLGGKSPGLASIPRLASGGVVEQATTAMIGENGAEAVMPLENNTEWIDKLANKINGTSSSGLGDTHIPSKLDRPRPENNVTINVSGVFATSVAEQRKVADLIAKRINESLGSRNMQRA